MCAGAVMCRVFCACMYVSAYICVYLSAYMGSYMLFLEVPEFNLPLALTSMLLGYLGGLREKRQACPPLCSCVPEPEGQVLRTD